MFGKKNYQSGRMTVDGRIFEIEFWDSSFFDLPSFRIYEIVTNKRGKERNIYVEEGWVDNGDRLGKVKVAIHKYLTDEKARAEDLKQIKEFCTSGRT